MSNEPLRTISDISVYDNIDQAMRNGAVPNMNPTHPAIASVIRVVAQGEKIPYGAQKDDLERLMRKTYDGMIGTAVNSAKTIMEQNGIANCYVVVEQQESVVTSGVMFGRIRPIDSGDFYGGNLSGITPRVEFERGIVHMKMAYTVVPFEPKPE